MYGQDINFGTSLTGMIQCISKLKFEITYTIKYIRSIPFIRIQVELDKLDKLDKLD